MRKGMQSVKKSDIPIYGETDRGLVSVCCLSVSDSLSRYRIHQGQWSRSGKGWGAEGAGCSDLPHSAKERFASIRELGDHLLRIPYLDHEISPRFIAYV